MAFVHIISAKDNAKIAQPPVGGVQSGVAASQLVLVGNPNTVTKLTVVPGAFAAAGSPNAVISNDDRVLIINTDTALDVAIVRAGHSPGAPVVPVPIPVPTGGLASYVVLVPGNATDVFIRAMV